jgi:hypothetical protein
MQNGETELRPAVAAGPAQGPVRRGAAVLVRMVKILATFHLVAFAWIFFRAANLSDAWTYAKGCLRLRDRAIACDVLPDLHDSVAAALGVCILLLAIDLPQYLSGQHAILLRRSWLLRVGVLAILTTCLMACRGGKNAAFIYFQF